MKKVTVIRLKRESGFVAGTVVLDYEDATVEAIARSAIAVIESCMSMSEGDTITVTEEKR